MPLKSTTVISLSCLILSLCFVSSSGQAQTLWFGTVKAEGKISQARFEADSLLQNIVYAPYGRTPTAFTNIKATGQQLTFKWQYNQLLYSCVLIKGEGKVYTGTCAPPANKGEPIEMIMREFTPEDAELQGNSLRATDKEIQILERTLALLNNGSNWSRAGNRVCDSSSYPYKWSLFCALHQASIDVDVEYRHLRPAIQATRQAIEEATAGRKFAHLL
ncbi:MAG TPA: hypothetical protein VM935_12350, partial [Chitinophagaceae bacterium]|nr:hypothetical protein [Chitinophagaceae bacterium]